MTFLIIFAVVTLLLIVPATYSVISSDGDRWSSVLACVISGLMLLYAVLGVVVALDYR